MENAASAENAAAAERAAAAGDPAPAGPVWRFLLRPRWLGWHLLMVVSFWGMLWLGDWQLHRALSGNALSSQRQRRFCDVSALDYVSWGWHPLGVQLYFGDRSRGTINLDPGGE
jgi:hypothetical protein